MRLIKKYLEAYLQLGLFVIIALLVILKENTWYWLLMGQLAIGMYQLTSASYHTISRTFKYPWNLRFNHYWLGVIIYGCSALTLLFMDSAFIFKWFFVGGAYVLSFYYFWLTSIKLNQIAA